MKTYSITISGKVQGVFFRKFTKEKAIELGLRGFVRNQADGTVYVEVTGSENLLNDFKKWCHEGSPYSSVQKVEVREIEEKDFKSFEITY
jgi:acylphosphatase